jgi:hypothetical protein
MRQLSDDGFTVLLEIASNRTPQFAFDFNIAVGESPVQAAGKLTPDRGLATAGHANQYDTGHGDR